MLITGLISTNPARIPFHRAAGATEVVISSAKRWAILHELREEMEWDLGALVTKMSPVDLVLVEGFKRDAFPKA